MNYWEAVSSRLSEAPGGSLHVDVQRHGDHRLVGRVRLAAVLGIITWGVNLTVFAADVFKMPAGLRSLEMVVVDHPGNAPDTNGFGAVGYAFRIGKFEVTAARYVEFLNAKARADGYGALWNNDMDKARSGPGPRCEIRRSGGRGSYHHRVAPDFANRPYPLTPRRPSAF